jgi:hypothetical protein
MVHAKRRGKPGRLSERVEERLPSEGISAKDLVGGHAEDGALGGGLVQDVLHGGVSAEVYLRCTCRHGLEQLDGPGSRVEVGSKERHGLLIVLKVAVAVETER